MWIYNRIGFRVDVVMALGGAVDAIGPVKAGVEPLRGVGRRDLPCHGKRICEPGAGITLDPDFSVHPLHQAASNGQAQSHTVFALSSRQSKEIVENFQVKFGRNAGSGIGNTDLYRIWM